MFGPFSVTVTHQGRAAQAFILSTYLEEGESWYALICLSVCHNRRAFKTLKNNRKKAGPFSVGTTVAHSRVYVRVDVVELLGA